MNPETIIYEKRPQERIAVITLNRPEKLNALNNQILEELMNGLDEADKDPQVRAVVLIGSGRAFSSGADLSGGGPGSGERRPSRDLLSWVDRVEENHRQHRRIREMHKPVIAAVHGYALGAGFELAITCDMIVAAKGTRLGAPEIRHGSIITTVLPWLVGPMWAKRIILTGDFIDAKTAERIGLCVEVVPEERLLERACWLAARIAKVPVLGVRMNKKMIDGIMEMAGIEQGYSYSDMVEAICHALTPMAETADGRLLEEVRTKEGLRGFLAAREASFRD